LIRTRVFVAALAATACVSNACDRGSPAEPSAGPAVRVYAVNPPAVYVPKVKNLLTGLPASDAELLAVQGDPRALAALVDRWMATPEYQAKMLRFFQLAFQQTQIAITDFSDQVFPRLVDVNKTTAPLLLQNAQESFARTALELENEGRPFTETTTTTRFMMTPALMELYAFIDAWHVDDAGVVTDRFAQAHPGQSFVVEASEGPIPIADTLDPTSARYMRWYDPDVASSPQVGAGCGGDPLTFPATGIALHFLLYGALDFRPSPLGAGAGVCGQYAGSAGAPQLAGTDFTAWKMVTVRAPGPGEATTAFYDLPTLRSSNELVLSVPRVGFFSTPAFFANWPTNTSNQMRVTADQALIVATGQTFDPSDPTPSPTTPGLDAAHAGAPCVPCHRLLDPTRSILAATYSWNYHEQTDPAFASQPGVFQFAGYSQPVASIADFGAALSAHPRFGAAWVQKLCFYAASGACDETDPAFAQVLDAFRSSGWSWSALVRAFYTSPLAIDAQTVAVARRDHLCAALGTRLGLGDVCGLDALTPRVPGAVVPLVVAGLPSDGYGRGATAPVLPNDPTLFFRAGTERICEELAQQVVDAPEATRVPGAAQWSSDHAGDAIDGFVSVVMDLSPLDARAAAARSILSAHYAAALAEWFTPTAALQSTFVAACLAPSAVALGL
jgi:hypothetical protein